MKKVLFLVLSTALIIACNSNSGFKHSPADTTKTLALYRSGAKGDEAKVELVYKIRKDSLMWVTVDQDSNTVNNKKKWARAVLYFVPVLDTAKKLVFVPYPKEGILIDGEKNVDSIFKIYKLHFATATPPDTGLKAYGNIKKSIK